MCWGNFPWESLWPKALYCAGIVNGPRLVWQTNPRGHWTRLFSVDGNHTEMNASLQAPSHGTPIPFRQLCAHLDSGRNRLRRAGAGQTRAVLWNLALEDLGGFSSVRPPQCEAVHRSLRNFVLYFTLDPNCRLNVCFHVLRSQDVNPLEYLLLARGWFFRWLWH